jgi:hypothetical protein
VFVVAAVPRPFSSDHAYRCCYMGG